MDTTLPTIPRADSIVNMDSPLSPTVFAGMLGVAKGRLYQEHEEGLFGPKPLVDMTYREALHIYRENLRKSIEVKLEKERNEQALRLAKLETEKAFKLEKAALRVKANTYNSEGEDVEDTMHPLMAKKLTQTIRTERAKEVQAWLKVAQDRDTILLPDKVAPLIEPIILAIKNVLIAVSTDYPETREYIDKAMGNLYELGEAMITAANKDKELFITEMLSKDLDDHMMELGFIDPVLVGDV